MSWHYSRALVEEYSQVVSSDTILYALSNEMNTASRFSFNGKTNEFYNLSQFGTIFARLMEDRGVELWTWFLEDSPAKRLVQQQEVETLVKKNLWREMCRVIREVQPRVVFAENVSEKAILQAQDDLLELGFDCEYVKLSAKDVGADHERERYWLLAYTYNYGELCRTFNAEAPFLQELRNSVWETYPGEFRVSDGVAFRMDRLKALGNGQVPLVAASAWCKLHERILK